MSGIINLVKWVLIIIGAIAVYYGVSLQAKYGVTVKSLARWSRQNCIHYQWKRFTCQ